MLALDDKLACAFTSVKSLICHLIMLKNFYYCSGQIIPPTNGTKLTFLPGTTRKIDWSVVSTSQIRLRSWSFKSTDGSRKGDLTGFNGVTYDPKNLSLIPRFEIEEPATLILQNVDDRYDGMYTFRLIRRNVVEERSKVTVIIAGKI